MLNWRAFWFGCFAKLSVHCGADKVKYIADHTRGRVVRHYISLVIPVPIARRRRRYILVISHGNRLDTDAVRDSFTAHEVNAVPAVAPVVGVAVVFVEVKVSAAVTISTAVAVMAVVALVVLTPVVVLHVAVVVPVLGISRTGAQCKSEHRN